MHCNLTTITLAKDANVGEATITDAGSGWRLISITWPGSAETYSYLRIYVSSGAQGFEAFLGDGVSGMLFWNEALEAHNAWLTDDGTPDVGWAIHMPAAGNGLNNDLTTFVLTGVVSSDTSPTPYQTRDGVRYTGDPAPYFHGFQAYPGEVVTGSLEDLATGTYKLMVVEIGRGIINLDSLVTLDLNKEE